MRAPSGLVRDPHARRSRPHLGEGDGGSRAELTRVTCLGDVGLVGVDRGLRVPEPLLDDAEVVDDRWGVVLGVGLPEEATRSLEIPELEEADAFREVAPGAFGVVRTRIVGDEQGAHADGNCPLEPQFTGDSTGAIG